LTRQVDHEPRRVLEQEVSRLKHAVSEQRDRHLPTRLAAHTDLFEVMRELPQRDGGPRERLGHDDRPGQGRGLRRRHGLGREGARRLRLRRRGLERDREATAADAAHVGAQAHLVGQGNASQRLAHLEHGLNADRGDERSGARRRGKVRRQVGAREVHDQQVRPGLIGRVEERRIGGHHHARPVGVFVESGLGDAGPGARRKRGSRF
jgi:hypothetical protein